MHKTRLAAACAVSIVASLTVAAGASAAPPAPSNDLGGHAIAITPRDHENASTLGPVASFDSTSATLQSAEPQPTGAGCGPVSHTAWYSVTVASPTLIHLSAPPGDGRIVPEIAVYTGSIPSTLVACNYTGSTVTEESMAALDLNADAGTKYWIQVGQTTASGGLIYLKAYYDNAPTNDAISSAQALSAAQLQSGRTLDADSATFANRLRADATLASVEANEPQPAMSGCVAFARTRWFTWTAPSNGLFDSTPIGGSTVQVAAWSAATPSGTSPATELACATADSNTAARFTATQGTKYWIQLGSTGTAGWDDVQALFFEHVVPTNDTWNAATSVSFPSIATTDGVLTTFDNTLATAQGEIQPSSCININHSTWFTVISPDDINLTVGMFITSTGGPRGGNDVIAIYRTEHNHGGPYGMVSCNAYDGSADKASGFTGISDVAGGAVTSARLKANITYYIQVSGSNRQWATGDLYLQATHLAPALAQSSSKGAVNLSFFTDSTFHGKTVYFYRRSGMTGQVVPLGTGTVDSTGVARRTFNAKTGQILALYGKIIGVTDIYSPYSNSVTFKVQ